MQEDGVAARQEDGVATRHEEEVVVGCEDQAARQEGWMLADRDTWLPGLTPKCKDYKCTETCL
jgi:hypothetical protein